MAGNCPICLGTLRLPVSIPCGHVHCEQCLTNHVNSHPDAIKSTCPTCRTPFNTVTPDLTYLPKKYHHYITPSLRRIYIDSSLYDELQAKIERLEGRVKTLQDDKETLMVQCERYMATAQAHAKGEKEARNIVTRLTEELEMANGNIESLCSDLYTAQTEVDDAKNEEEETRTELELIKRRNNKLKRQLKELQQEKETQYPPRLSLVSFPKRKNPVPPEEVDERSAIPGLEASSPSDDAPLLNIQPKITENSSNLAPILRRNIRPLPRSNRLRTHSQSPIIGPGSITILDDDLPPTVHYKRPKLHALGQPFRTEKCP